MVPEVDLSVCDGHFRGRGRVWACEGRLWGGGSKWLWSAKESVEVAFSS